MNGDLDQLNRMREPGLGVVRSGKHVGLLGAVLFLVWTCSSAVQGAAMDETEFTRLNPTERFKVWLASPPNVERLVFMEKLPQDPTKPPSLETGITSSTNFSAAALEWQPGAMAFRTLPDTNYSPLASFPGLAFAFLSNRMTFIESATNLMVYHLEEDRVAKGEFPPMYDVASFRLRRSAEPLNLGLSHLLPGSARWEGNQFTAIGSGDKRPITIRGKITAWEKDIPSELSVSYSNSMGQAQYRLRYAYDSYRFPFFPSEITTYFKYQGREIEYQAYRITEIRASFQPLPTSMFDATNMMPRKEFDTRLATNGGLYLLLPHGGMIKSESLEIPRVRFQGSDYYRARYVYAGFALIFIGFCAFAVKAQRQKQQLNIKHQTHA